MRYSIIVALDNNFALTNNFVENLLLTESLQNDSELVIVSDGCANIQIVKETIGVGVNEKAVLRFYQTALSFTSISIFPW